MTKICHRMQILLDLFISTIDVYSSHFSTPSILVILNLACLIFLCTVTVQSIIDNSVEMFLKSAVFPTKKCEYYI